MLIATGKHRHPATQATGLLGRRGIASCKDLHFAAGLWASGGASGELNTSTDGRIWIARNSGFLDSQIEAVTYADNLWVIVGEDGKLATSGDGVVFTQRTSTFPDHIRDLAYDGQGVWMVAGRDGWVAGSADGINWTAFHSALQHRLFES